MVAVDTAELLAHACHHFSAEKAAQQGAPALSSGIVINEGATPPTWYLWVCSEAIVSEAGYHAGGKHSLRFFEAKRLANVECPRTSVADCELSRQRVHHRPQSHGEDRMASVALPSVFRTLGRKSRAKLEVWQGMGECPL